MDPESSSQAPPEEIVFEDPSVIGEFLRASMPPHSQAKRKELIVSLPKMTEEELAAMGKKNDCCPICFVQFSAVLASEEMALAMDSPAVASEDLGVTRLAGTCGHVFCRKDISTWIRQNDSCPTCRRPFITPPNRDSSEELTRPRIPGDEDLFWRVFQRAELPMARPGRSTRTDIGDHSQDNDRSEFAALYS